MPPHAFAVDGTRLVGASFRRDGGRFRLLERHAMPLSPGALAAGPLGGPVADPGAFAAAVAGLVERFARRPREASLVLPDAWARGVVVELGDLPARTDLQSEILRFRLRKLVPFRVEELRVAATPIAPVAGQQDPVRALALYASEPLCAGCERAFDAAGVRLGQIVGASLARWTALGLAGRLGGLVALAAVESAGFTLIVARDGEPALWRQKSFAELDAGESHAPRLAAELRLTRTFLAERLAAPRLDAVLLSAPEESRATWRALLAEAFERPVAALAADELPLAVESGEGGAAELAALVGAVCREVT
ncbi:MAG: hypothetical protein NDJ75_00770 [Thermoanaerobaculia bacterium]|nr:hypothetical protein [Thermoanaerobaculia bacterium]